MGIVISNYVGGTPRAIAKALGWKVSLADGDRVRSKTKNVLNYGTTQHLRGVWWDRDPDDAALKPGVKVLNFPHKVIGAVNKELALYILKRHDVPCLDFTKDPAVALAWLPEGRSVVCRTVLNGHSGQGIHIVKWEDWKAGGRREPQFPQGVKLFTKYFPKQEEVRVHVFAGEILGYAAKRRKAGVQADPWIRSHDKGWIFAADGVVHSEAARDVAVRAVSALGLDFGAVDVGLGRDGVAVFEVNTAPGLEGRTLAAYVGKFKQYFGIEGR